MRKEYCSIELTEGRLKAFVYAIRNHYWYQMYLGESVRLLDGQLRSDQHATIQLCSS